MKRFFSRAIRFRSFSMFLSSGGAVNLMSLAREPASSITSMALSGRNRSEM